MLKLFLKAAWLTWCWIEVALVSSILYLVSWLPKKLISFFYLDAARFLSRLFVNALNINLKLHEKNLNPLPQHYILIANHPSAAEDFAIPALFNVLPLAKQGVRHWFIIGRISYAAGAIYVKRDNRESRHAAREALTECVKKGNNIALFPEGGCKGRRIYETFQTGAFDIALQTGTPVLPVFIHYEAQDRYEWREPYSLIAMFWRIMTSKNNTANYYVYDAVEPTGFEDKETFAKHMHTCYLNWQKQYLE